MKVVKNGRVFYDGKLVEADISIKNGKIEEINNENIEGAEEKIDASGKVVLPGAIDTHVHFRDFKESNKEDWNKGSQAAIAGGVTTVVDQPNTIPPIDNICTFLERKKLGKKLSYVDFGINGAAYTNSDIEGLAEKGCLAFGEAFFSWPRENNPEESGNMGMGTDKDKALNSFSRILDTGKVLCIHAEMWDEIKRGMKRFVGSLPSKYSEARSPESEISAIKKVVDISEEIGTKLHIDHISTAKGAEIVDKTEATCEVTPHHLLMNEKNLDDLKGYAKTNPPVRDEDNREKLWNALSSGKIDIVASDHAPHMVKEKESDFWEAPSGVPGVETMLPLLAYQVKQENLSLSRLVEVLSKTPANIFGLTSKGQIKKGNDADLVIIDFENLTSIDENELHSKCGWSPFHDNEAIFPEKTILRGDVVFDKGSFGKRKGVMVEMG